MYKQQEENGLWIPDTIESKQTTNKGYQDILYSVKNNRLETLDISQSNAFSDNFTVNRGISLLAQNVAQTPLVIYRGDQAIPAPNHDVYGLFIKPSEDVCEFELWEKLIIYLYNDGESFFFLNKNNNGVIREIYTLNPRYMKHEKDKKTKQIISWVFNNKIPMAKEDIIHFKLPATTGLRGLSPLQTVLREISTDKSASQYNKSFFENYTMLGGYLKTDKDAQISPEEMKRVVNAWNADHRGTDRAYSIGGLLGGMEYVNTDISQTAMQFAESRRDIRDRLMTVLGVSKTVMGIAEDVNRANAEEAMRQLWELTLKPLLVRVEQKLNAELFIPYYKGYTCKFDLSNIEELKKDLNVTFDIAQKMLNMGYTRNEINDRLTLDMPNSKDDDDLIPYNLVPRNQIDTPKEPEPKKQVEISVDYEKIADKKMAPLMKIFRSKLKAHLFKQRTKVLKIVNNADFPFENELKTLFNEENTRLQKITKPLYYDGAKMGIQLSDRSEKDVDDSIINISIVNNSIDNITHINKSVYNKVKLAILEKKQDEIRDIYNYAEKQLKDIAKEEVSNIVEKSQASYKGVI